MRSPPLLFFCVAVVGALSGLCIDVDLWWGLALVVISSLLVCFSRMRLLKAFCVCGALAAFAATHASYEKQQFDALLKSLPKEGTFEGELLDLSDSLAGERVGLFEVEASSQSDLSNAKRFVVVLKLVGAASAKSFAIGDTLRIKGKISKAQHALSPGQVDGYWFGLSRGVHGRISVSEPHLVAVMKDKDRSIVGQTKQSLKEDLSSQLTPREAGLLLALIVGDIKLFDEEQQSQYRNIGAGHLLAVSGLQVSILSVIFFRLFLALGLLIPWISRRSLARYPALFLTLLFIWTFVALCGAPPSAFRAALMTTFALCASVYAWPTTSLDVFGAAGLISLLISPAAVVDPSFWLSYGAVFGLIIAAHFCRLLPEDVLLLDLEKTQSSWQTKLRTLIIASLGAGLITLPFSAYYFAEVSLSGLIVNLFLVPVAGFLQTPAILLVALGGLLQLPSLYSVASFFAGTLEAICMTLDDLLGHTYALMPLSMPGLILSLIAVFMLVASARPYKRMQKLLAVALCCIVVAWPRLVPQSDSMVVTFLPVGQGDAAVLEIPPGKVMVIDGGGNHENVYNPGERIVTPFLKRRRIDVIDAVVLSHPHADHLMGLLPLFDNFQVKELWHNEIELSDPLMKQLIEVARLHGVRLRSRIEMPQQLRFGQAQINFLAPRTSAFDSPKMESTNNRSLVMRVSYARHSVLFPGDIEEIMENELTKIPEELRADIVKVPHHGSKSSSSESFVNATAASHVVFCTGVNNRFGFPHSQVIKRWQDSGATTWDTAMNGETTFRIAAETVQVKPFIATLE